MAGCGLGGGAKLDSKAPPDSPAVLRQDVDRIRTELTELRTRVEAAQRASSEHADRVAQETRAEFDAVRKAMEASSRHELQRQVEVLDAYARRVELLEKRTAELGQTLRRVELSLTGLESQLSRVLDGSAAPPSTPRGGAPSRAPATSPSPASKAPSESSTPAPDATAAAGAGLTPPAMLGPSRAAAGSAPAVASTTARETSTREAKAPAARATQDDAAPAAKGSSSTTAPTTIPERSPGPAAPRVAKASTPSAAPATGASTARALFDQAMENWTRGEQGQAVLEFEELVQTFPTDPLAASAQFRIGEAYYTARDFERAATEYRKAVDLAPKGKDTPQALLRLGLAYRAQKRESDARQTWSRLVKDFPDSDASEEARRALRGR
jgi:tol-pal system protein YbgF